MRGEKRLREHVRSSRSATTTRSSRTCARPTRRYKAITRQTAYHGTTLGALSLTGIPAIRDAVRAAPRRGAERPQHEPLPPARDEETEEEFTADLLAELEQTIEAMGPETVCLVHMEPVQNSGGAFIAADGLLAGVRELCDEYDILLSADEVITGFGRLGALVRVGALRHPAGHHHLGEGALLLVRGDRRRDR